MISGRFGLDFVIPMPIVKVSVHLPGITAEFEAVDFLIDTGSVGTYLHPYDAKARLGIDADLLADANLWPARRPTRGVGGASTYYVSEAVFLFHDNNGDVAREIVDEIDVAQPTLSNATIPSLLGMNILRQFRMRMDYVGHELVLW